MAVNIGELSILLGGDAKPWIQTVKIAQSSLEDLKAEVKAAGQAIDSLTQKQFNLMLGWKNARGDATRAFSAAIGDVKQGLVDQHKALNVNQVGMDKMAAATVNANHQVRLLGDNLKGTSSALWLMSRGLQQFGMAMTTAFTLPIVGAAVASVKLFTDWQQGAIDIQRAGEMTAAQGEQILNNFIAISQKVPLTVEELQDAGYAAAQAGIKGTEAITNFASAAAKLAQVGGDALTGLPVTDLANSLIKVANAFGEAGENMEKVNNIASTLFTVAKAMPGRFNEVVAAMVRVAGTASLMGVNVAQAAAMVSAVIAAGIPASRVGTELSRAFLEMSQNADKVAQAIGYADANTKEFKDRMQTDAMGVLEELMGRYDEVGVRLKKMEHMQDLFGTVALRALIPLSQHMNIYGDLLARANQELETGALLDIEFAAKSQSLAGTIKVFTNNLKALGFVIANDLAPYVNLFLKDVSTGLRKVVAGWQVLDPAVKSTVILFAALLAIVGPLALLLNTLFFNPIAGLVTFLTFSTRAVVNLGLTAAASGVASLAMEGFTGTLMGAAAASLNLAKGLFVLLGKFAAVLLIVGAVTIVMFKLAEILGIGIKFPKLPEIKFPTYPTTGRLGKLGAGGLPGETELERADKAGAQKKVKEIQKELREKRKAQDKEMDLIEKRIRDAEKLRDKEAKTTEDSVNAQEKALQKRRDQWTEEQRLEEEKIRTQEEAVETARETLRKSQKALSDLKDVQDKEVDIAQGQVDYAEMNLKAVQDALQREKILGRDEFDASFRLAEERVKTWENATKLARENLIKVKKKYQEQIDAQQEIVEANQDQVDIQNKALDDLRDALKKRGAIVDKEIDLMEAELRVRRENLDSVRTAQEEKLDLLREERDNLRATNEEELELIQDRLDAAQDLVQDIQNMGVAELPEASQAFKDLTKEIQGYTEEVQKVMKGGFGQLLPQVEVKKGGLGEDIKNFFTKDLPEMAKSPVKTAETIIGNMRKTWSEEGGKAAEGFKESWKEADLPGTLGAILKGMRETADREGRKTIEGLKRSMDEAGITKKWLVDGILGPGTYDEANKQSKELGVSIVTVLLASIQEKLSSIKDKCIQWWIDGVFGPGTCEALKKKSQEMGVDLPTMLITTLQKTIGEIGGRFLQTVFDKFFGKGRWDQIRSEAKNQGISIPQLIWEGFTATIGTMPERIRNAVDQNFLRPIREAWRNISSIIDLSGITSKLDELVRKARDWGRDFVDNLASGLRETIDKIKRAGGSLAKALERFLGFSEPPEEGPLHFVRTWGKHLVELYGEGIEQALPALQGALSGINLDTERGAIGQRAMAIPATRAEIQPTAVTPTTINKNWYIQPGMMIASQGEIRNLVRMLQPYIDTENERLGK